MRTLEEIRQGYQDVVGMVHGMRRHQIEIAILVADIPDLLAELNTTQCAHAFVSDSLSYETTRFRAALAEKDAEIAQLKSSLAQSQTALTKLSRGLWKVC